MYIKACSTISFQPTFRNEGFSDVILPLGELAQCLPPDYGSFIAPMERRRMSEVLKMAITCALDCLLQAEVEQPDAIIVGTSMGCSKNTEAFLGKIVSANGNLLSPTSFILSTHNTIAGQISLKLKNHNFNITHSQNSLSFEHALIDSMLCLTENLENVLVGAADEEVTEIYNLPANLGIEPFPCTYGASFFVLSAEMQGQECAKLIDAVSLGQTHELQGAIIDFLGSNHLSSHEIDLVLYSSSNQHALPVLDSLFGDQKLVDFQKLSGVYFTNSAFAMHYGFDILVHGHDSNIKCILVCNNLLPENIGLILLARQDYLR